MHFKYTINLVKDNAYGRLDKNGEWNGMIGEIISGEADIAVADLFITHMREEAVDFTQPFLNSGISILFKKPTKKYLCRAMPTRTMTPISYFFNLITSYTANLAAFSTVERVEYPIKNAEDLAGQQTIKYGCLAYSSIDSYFLESNINTYRKMWQFMSKHREEVLTPSNSAGVQKVEASDGMYAFLMESLSIEYLVERYCNLTQIGGLLDSKGYGIATKKNSPLRTKLSQAILKLSESGTLRVLKDRWWKQKRGGGQCGSH